MLLSLKNPQGNTWLPRMDPTLHFKVTSKYEKGGLNDSLFIQSLPACFIDLLNGSIEPHATKGNLTRISRCTFDRMNMEL